MGILTCNYMTIEEIKEQYKGCVPVPIVAIANALGLAVYETSDFSDEQSGSIRKEGDNFVIYVNAQHPDTRKRFTIAHEIAHFLHDQDYFQHNNDEIVSTVKQPLALHRSSTDELPEQERKREVEANKTAADLLMPEEKFREIFEQAKTIEEVAATFQVSPSAATIRAEKLMHTFIT